MNNYDYIDHLNNYFKSYACISKNYDYIFYVIYKNGSTKVSIELKDHIYEFNKTIKHKDEETKKKNNNNNNSILENLNKYDIKNIFKVAFVRNPIDRYISLFYYFKGTKRGKLMNIYNDTNINDWTINYFRINYNKLEYISNYHFNSQSSFLIYKDKLICDEVIKLENIDYQKLESRNIKLTERIINKSNKDNIKLNQQSISIIKEIYVDDFNNFYNNLI